MIKIKAAIETVRRQRTTRREARQAVPLGMVALVGYTNAGKSHAVQCAHARGRARLAENVRHTRSHDPSDSFAFAPPHPAFRHGVGFLRDLPPDLIAAFRATLEEAQEAALILQVTDVSNPNHAGQDAGSPESAHGFGN